MLTLQDRAEGALLGLAIGDAVGTTLEFTTPGQFIPIDDMVGGGPFNLPRGAWTDDTSMALCLAASLTENGYDVKDQQHRYFQWYTNGYMSSTGICFDIGFTTVRGISDCYLTGEPYSGMTDPKASGNGSIMRLAPVPMFFHGDFTEAVEKSGDSSRTTHGSPECISACQLYGGMIVNALRGMSKDEILNTKVHVPLARKIQDIADGNYKTMSPPDIKGSGYVVDSLQAALWAFYTTDNYRDAILASANLGRDADTTAAVCGQVAGAYYGRSGIPEEWAENVFERDMIVTLANKLMEG